MATDLGSPSSFVAFATTAFSKSSIIGSSAITAATSQIKWTDLVTGSSLFNELVTDSQLSSSFDVACVIATTTLSYYSSSFSCSMGSFRHYPYEQEVPILTQYLEFSFSIQSGLYWVDLHASVK